MYKDADSSSSYLPDNYNSGNTYEKWSWVIVELVNMMFPRRRGYKKSIEGCNYLELNLLFLPADILSW